MRRLTTLTVFLFTLQLAGPVFAQVDSYTVGVDGMACPFCAYGIEKKLKALDGVDSLDIHIKKGTVDVHLGDGKTVTPDQLRTAIKEAGFEIRDLHLRGEATIEKTDGAAEARFSEAFALPIAGTVSKTGKRSIKGEVVRNQGSWRLKLTK